MILVADAPPLKPFDTASSYEDLLEANGFVLAVTPASMKLWKNEGDLKFSLVCEIADLLGCSLFSLAIVGNEFAEIVGNADEQLHPPFASRKRKTNPPGIMWNVNLQDGAVRSKE